MIPFPERTRVRRFGRYGTFGHRFEFGRLNFGAGLCKIEDHWSLNIFGLWITLFAAKVPSVDGLETWSFSLSRNEIYLRWGKRYKFIYMPWSLDHHRGEVMLKDGSFVPMGKWNDPEPENLYRETFPYHYLRRNGTVQSTTATVTVERRSWCWRAWPFRVFRWPSKTETSIDVKFADEIGERTGSWKGGCVGCGYGLKPGETPKKCLQRMQEERRFN